jgi:membrane protein implicated in regulation of membrane protease activity
VAINDTFDAILLGMFLFGLLFTVGSFILGVIDVGWEASHDGGGDHFGHSVLNVGVILTFITWLGGVSYLARNSFDAALGISVIIGLVAAFAAAYGIFRMLGYVRTRENVMRAEDYRLPGQIARVASPIREGGTGEVVYVQQGRRQVSAARSERGVPIARGAEVVILRVDKGIAYVDLWDQLISGSDGQELAQLQ